MTTIKDIIIKFLEENDYDKNLVYPLKDLAEAELGEEIKATTYDRTVRKAFNEIMEDDEILLSNINLAKKAQRYADTNRIERASFRNFARIDNAVTEYNARLVELLENNNLKDFTTVHQVEDSTETVGIVHLTDLHLNELVCLKNNKYDFVVASERLQKLALIAKKHFTAFGVKKVLVAFTGDMINSDRRIDELLAMATNRSKATFLAVLLLQQFILDMNELFDVVVTGVSGNESRIRDEIGYNELVATDNYDYTILEMLKLLFKGSESIEFVDCGHSEGYITIGGTTVLLLHGHSQKTDIEKYVQQLKGRYSAKGIAVDYVLMGHIHSCRIGDSYARGSSLVGSNDYSETALNLAGKASQNIFIITKDGDIHGTRIDLQNTKQFDGYDIKKELTEYNAKSYEKSVKGKKQYRIRI